MFIISRDFDTVHLLNEVDQDSQDEENRASQAQVPVSPQSFLPLATPNELEELSFEDLCYLEGQVSKTNRLSARMQAILHDINPTLAILTVSGRC